MKEIGNTDDLKKLIDGIGPACAALGAE